MRNPLAAFIKIAFIDIFTTVNTYRAEFKQAITPLGGLFYQFYQTVHTLMS